LLEVSIIEVEIRALIPNPGCVEAALREKGFSEEPEFEQLDIMFDKPDASLFRSGQKIRIRTEKGCSELTYKGRFAGDSAASRRTEVNLPIPPDKVGELGAFLEAIGYPECFRIPKRRKVFRQDTLNVTLDWWPIIGCLMEIEGDEKDAHALASEVAPHVEFRNYRLKELFRMLEKRTGKSLGDLKRAYESETGLALGCIELLLD